MERLNKSTPTVPLSAAQKAELADLESQCVAKIAERELLLNGEIEKAVHRGDAEAIAGGGGGVRILVFGRDRERRRTG